MRRASRLLAACVLAGCVEADGAAHTPSRPVRRVAVVSDIAGPESVRYDADQDAFLVSVMAGYGSVKDGNGMIIRFAAGDPSRSDVLVQGGTNGATLHAPKGIAIKGDTLFVTDIDVLRRFDKRTGRPLGIIDFAAHAPALLNDVAVAPDGTMRVTDTGIAMTPKGVIHRGGDRIFTVDGTRIRIVSAGNILGRPNGITWDVSRSRWLVVSFDPFTSTLYSLDASGVPAPIVRGKGKWDGVEVLQDGAVLVTSWSDSTLHVVRGDSIRPLIRHLPEPADLGVDTRRRRVAIPISVMGRVELWDLP